MLSRIWGLARARPLAMIAMLTLLSMVMGALLADVVATHDPLSQDVVERLKAPGPDHFSERTASGVTSSVAWFTERESHYWWGSSQ